MLKNLIKEKGISYLALFNLIFRRTDLIQRGLKWDKVLHLKEIDGKYKKFNNEGILNTLDDTKKFKKNESINMKKSLNL